MLRVQIVRFTQVSFEVAGIKAAANQAQNDAKQINALKEELEAKLGQISTKQKAIASDQNEAQEILLVLEKYAAAKADDFRAFKWLVEEGPKLNPKAVVVAASFVREFLNNPYILRGSHASKELRKLLEKKPTPPLEDFLELYKHEKKPLDRAGIIKAIDRLYRKQKTEKVREWLITLLENETSLSIVAFVGRKLRNYGYHKLDIKFLEFWKFRKRKQEAIGIYRALHKKVAK